MREQGYTFNAIASGDKITVFSSGNGLSFNIEFILNNNILYTEVLYNQADSRITAINLTLAIALVDCIGQVKGYPEGALTEALSNETAMNYTIENEGIEIKQLDNSQNIYVKVDLNSSFSFVGI